MGDTNTQRGFFCLIPEDIRGAGSPIEPLRIPSGVSTLSSAPEPTPSPPTLTPAADAPSFGAPPPGVVLEPIRFRERPGVLMLRPEDIDALVNGIPAPRATILRTMDQLQIDARFTLHVTFFQPTPIEIAQDAGLCPVCRTPIEDGTRIYRCPHSSTVLHCEGDRELRDEDDSGPLQCAQVAGSCPDCHKAIQWKEGFLYYPDLGEVQEEGRR